ncbi:LysR family transcriptional regulator [Pontibacillus sp. ALD_SL1]|uniref:LysR family transcriptional regulator n=1 Tax=Pontibacillus sp. ALD_SL1 TaxID=2777185 RepID=UPI001A960429|nr:LysR family transcriptional regulator [Pontibacillus sp. ALD_SL1]QST01018.1 LysR family transcriptional regulator [Pontibacillus sp. ALD_SL1]
MLQKLNAFIEVAKQQSFTKAAETLYISQPALSKQMRKLEDELGFSLFNRASYGVELTEKGRGIAEELTPLFGRIHQTVKQYQFHEDKIRFGSTPVLTSYYLPTYYEKLARGNLHVTVVKDDTEDLLPLLEEGEIDAAIIQDTPSYHALLSSYLFTDSFIAAIPVSSPLAEKQEVTFKECLEEAQIIPTKGPLSEKMQAVMREYEFTGEVVETQYHAIAGLVALGMGIAYLPEMMVRQVEYRGVVFVPIQNNPFKRDMYLYARTQENLDYLNGLFTGG